MRIQLLLHALSVSVLVSCSDAKNEDQAQVKSAEATSTLEGQALIDRGNYLVTSGGCNDCHSPKIMSPMGPEADSTKLLSGHPAGSKLPPIDASALKPGGWVLMAPDITSFVGPWGISYAANLTPDSATGIGAWSETNFIKALRTGKHMGIETGRPIMPPMPYPYIGQFNDEDLKAMFAYLKSLPPVSNKVPEPTPPNQVATVK